MRWFVPAFLAVFVLATCSQPEIDGSKVNVNDQTHEYTFKDSGAKVTGTVVSYKTDEATGKLFRYSVVQVKDGKRIGVAHGYYASGKLSVEYTFDALGLESGTEKDYDESGVLRRTVSYQNDQPNGNATFFNEKGSKYAEGVFTNGKVVQYYMFDAQGNKYVPDEFRLVGTWKWGLATEATLTLNSDSTYHLVFSNFFMNGDYRGTFVVNSDQKVIVLKHDKPMAFEDTFAYSFVDDNDLLLTFKDGQSTAQRQKGGTE